MILHSGARRVYFENRFCFPKIPDQDFDSEFCQGPREFAINLSRPCIPQLTSNSSSLLAVDDDLLRGRRHLGGRAGFRHIGCSSIAPVAGRDFVGIVTGLDGGVVDQAEWTVHDAGDASRAGQELRRAGRPLVQTISTTVAG